MNQKAFKKQLTMITSKDDNATASLLGFAIANRVDPTSLKSEGNADDCGKKEDKQTSKRDDGGKAALVDKKEKGQGHSKDGGSASVNSKAPGGESGKVSRKVKNSNLIQTQGMK